MIMFSSSSLIVELENHPYTENDVIFCPIIADSAEKVFFTNENKE